MTVRQEVSSYNTQRAYFPSLPTPCTFWSAHNRVALQWAASPSRFQLSTVMVMSKDFFVVVLRLKILQKKKAAV